MSDTLAILAVVLPAVVLVLLVVQMLRPARVDLSAIEARLAAVESGFDRVERSLRDELARGRSESTGRGARCGKRWAPPSPGSATRS